MLKALLVPALALSGLIWRVDVDEPPTVTTDTALYCLSLAKRVEANGDMPALARALWEQGRAMCEHGQVRAGLARLRRAMIIVHGGDNH